MPYLASRIGAQSQLSHLDRALAALHRRDPRTEAVRATNSRESPEQERRYGSAIEHLEAAAAELRAYVFDHEPQPVDGLPNLRQPAA